MIFLFFKLFEETVDIFQFAEDAGSKVDGIFRMVEVRFSFITLIFEQLFFLNNNYKGG